MRELSQDEAEVLASLVGEGAKIYRFEPKQSKVEDLFLQVESGDEKGGTDESDYFARHTGKIADQILDCGGLFS